MSLGRTFIKGLWRENPILRLAIGLVPALGITHLALNGVYLGLATTMLYVPLLVTLGLSSSLKMWASLSISPLYHIHQSVASSQCSSARVRSVVFICCCSRELTCAADAGGTSRCRSDHGRFGHGPGPPPS